MYSVPNQKIITVYKEPCSKENLYSCINLAAMEKAATNLSAGGFKLWVYFAKNQDGYCFALSPKDANERFGLARTQYNNAVKELINKGYLSKQEVGNYYDFEEISIL